MSSMSKLPRTVKLFSVVVHDDGVAAVTALGRVFASINWFEGAGVENLHAFAEAQRNEYKRALAAFTATEGEGQDIRDWWREFRSAVLAEDRAVEAGARRPTQSAWGKAWDEHPVWVAAMEDSQGRYPETYDAPIVEGTENGGWRLLTPTAGREISWDPGGRKLTVTAGKWNPPSAAALPHSAAHLVAAGYELVSAEAGYASAE
jgi:hypothetical protein